MGKVVSKIVFLSCFVVALLLGQYQLMAQKRQPIAADAILKLSGTITLDSLIHYVHQQSGIRFSFNSKKVKGSKLINFPSGQYQLKSLLDHLSRTTSLYYSFYDGYVIFQDNPPKNKSWPVNFTHFNNKAPGGKKVINTSKAHQQLLQQSANNSYKRIHDKNKIAATAKPMVQKIGVSEVRTSILNNANKDARIINQPGYKKDSANVDSVKQIYAAITDTVRGLYINSFSINRVQKTNGTIDSAEVYEVVEEPGQKKSPPALFDTSVAYRSSSIGIYKVEDTAQQKNRKSNEVLKDKSKAVSKKKFFTFRNIRDRRAGFKSNIIYSAAPGDFNKKGADIDFGLQWKMPLPVQRSSYLYIGANGKNQPYQFLVPGIFIKKTFKQKNNILLELQALQHFYISELNLYSSITDASLSDSTKIYSETNLIKMYGYTAGLQYQRLVNDKWLIGMGLTYNIQNRALLHIPQVKLIDRTSYKDSFSVINHTNAEWKIINRNFLCLTPTIAYQTGKLQIGLQTSFPITSIYNNAKVFPVNAQLFCRWQLTK